MLVPSICLLATLAIPSVSAVETKTLFQVGAGIELENIALRSNGKILTTSISQLLLFQFDPTSNQSVPHLLPFLESPHCSVSWSSL